MSSIDADRSWIIRELSLEAINALPTADSPIPGANIVGIFSERARQLEGKGVEEVFYFDYEQEMAGLKEIYGVLKLLSASENFTLEDGAEIPKDSLILVLTNFDEAEGTVTVLFEV